MWDTILCNLWFGFECLWHLPSPVVAIPPMGLMMVIAARECDWGLWCFVLAVNLALWYSLFILVLVYVVFVPALRVGLIWVVAWRMPQVTSSELVCERQFFKM